MKKCVFFLMLMFAAISFSVAQTVVFSDNFDSYTAGSHLAASNSAWTTWSNAPGTAEDGAISTTVAASQPNSLYITGSNDQVYPFGNYTTGHYTVAFNYYVPSSGNGAYFNVQHVLLTEWAFECYFYNNGSGYVEAAGANSNFTFTTNTWFPVLFDINLDADSMYIYINNNLIYSNPFHYQSGNTAGTNQLAGINFYAGAPDNASGTYYVDDFIVTEVSAADVGHIAITPTEDIHSTVSLGQSETKTFTLTNPGTAPINYRVVATYDITNPNTASTGATNLAYCSGWVEENAVGFTSGGQYDLAVCFPAEQLQNHIGKTLNSVDVFLCNGLNAAAVRVFDMGNISANGPGEIIYEQTFVPDSGWNHIVLTNPVVIDGGDLWFGVWLDQPVSVYPIFHDGAAANEYSNWYRNGVGWKQFTDFYYNLCITGSIDGTPITPWMNISPTVGTLSPTAPVTVNAAIAPNNTIALGTHTGAIHFFSTDFDNPEEVVNVTLEYITVGVDEFNQIEISIYPNPATEYINIESAQASNVEIFNMSGQMVYSTTFSDNHLTVSTGNLTAGTYVVKVTSAGTTKAQKVIIK